VVGAAIWLLSRATRLPEMPRRKLSIDEEVEIMRKYNLQVVRRCALFLAAVIGVAAWWVCFLEITCVRDESL
jgi:hypothetical protein